MKPAPILPPPFDPVPVRARKDGWTPRRQREFIAELAATRCVLEACRRVGLSSESAYKLARRADAAGFRAAWSAVLELPEAPEPSTSAGARSREVRRHHQLPSRQLPHADGTCRTRQHRQLPTRRLPPAAAPSDPSRPRPAYSLEAFRRVARRRNLGRVPE